MNALDRLQSCIMKTWRNSIPHTQSDCEIFIWAQNSIEHYDISDPT